MTNTHCRAGDTFSSGYKMAEGGRRSSIVSSYKGSDEVFDLTCTPCAQDGSCAEAVNFCADCAEYLCTACTKYHKKFGATAGHNIVGADQAGQASVILPTERCHEHVREHISTYCAQHDVVVCSTCMALDHRACTGASYIPKIAGGPGQKKDRQRVKDVISQALSAMRQAKRSIQDRQETTDTERNGYLKYIKKYTEKLIKHAHDLEKAAVADVDGHHKKTTDDLQSKLKSIDDVTEKMTTRLNSLNNTHVTNDSQTFVDIKQGENEVKDAKQLDESVKISSLGQGKTSFVVEDSVDIFMNDVMNIGKVVLTKPYKVVLETKNNIQFKKDEHTCYITDTCVLSNGTILMTDFQNKCIKLLDTSNKISKSFKMPYKPWGICQTSKEEVAVTLLNEQKVQFVNVTGKWRLTRSFKVDDYCRGIACSNDQLLASCGGHPGGGCFKAEGPGFVGIFDMSGTILCKIQFDPDGRQIFSVPYHITTTGDGRKIHIADKRGGVITVDRRGNVLSRFLENLNWTSAVCAVSDTCLIVCGNEPDSVLQIDTSGNVVAELLGSKDGKDMPVSVSYVQSSSKLIISLESANEIKIFDLVLD